MAKRAITVRFDEHDWETIAAVAAAEGSKPATWLAREARRAALAAELRAWQQIDAVENEDWLTVTERESSMLWTERSKE